MGGRRKGIDYNQVWVPYVQPVKKSYSERILINLTFQYFYLKL